MVKWKVYKFKTWDEYLDVYGIAFENKVYCCSKQLLDDLRISGYSIRSLMCRYYRYSNKTIKRPKVNNLKWYLDNCYNFSNNILKISRKEKLYKRDIVGWLLSKVGYNNIGTDPAGWGSTLEKCRDKTLYDLETLQKANTMCESIYERMNRK